LILVASASYTAHYKSAAVYNVETNKWTQLDDGAYNRDRFDNILQVSRAVLKCRQPFQDQGSITEMEIWTDVAFLPGAYH
jgi:hypothetical protein